MKKSIVNNLASLVVGFSLGVVTSKYLHSPSFTSSKDYGPALPKSETIKANTELVASTKGYDSFPRETVKKPSEFNHMEYAKSIESDLEAIFEDGQLVREELDNVIEKIGIFLTKQIPKNAMRPREDYQNALNAHSKLWEILDSLRDFPEKKGSSVYQIVKTPVSGGFPFKLRPKEETSDFFPVVLNRLFYLASYSQNPNLSSNNGENSTK